jgi:dihydroxyacetone kinase
MFDSDIMRIKILFIVTRLGDTLLQEVNSKEILVMVNGMGGTPLSELTIATSYIHLLTL